MNIFILDPDPALCAEYHCDKHVIKMISEMGQLISTCLQDYPDSLTNVPQNIDLYAPIKQGKEIVQWLSADAAHFYWALRLFGALIHEYDVRYQKPDKFISARKIYDALGDTDAGTAIPNQDIIKNFPFRATDKEKYEIPGDVVESYREYYRLAKRGIAKWEKIETRKTPYWF